MASASPMAVPVLCRLMAVMALVPRASPFERDIHFRRSATLGPCAGTGRDHVVRRRSRARPAAVLKDDGVT